MPASFAYYTNDVPISFTKNGTSQHVDFSSVVSADANMVVLLIVNSLVPGSGMPQTFGSRGWSVFFLQETVPPSGASHHIVPLDSAKKCYLKATSSSLTVYAQGEFRDPSVIIHTEPVEQSPTTEAAISAWYNAGVNFGYPNPDISPSDIEAVILVGIGSTSTTANLGCRWFGSTATTLFTSDQWETTKWFVCKTEPLIDAFALYQLYTTGVYKVGPPETITAYNRWFEIGYILKGHGLKGVETITNEGKAAVTAWTTTTVAASAVPSGAEGILGILRSTPKATSEYGLRAVGSTNAVVLKGGNTTLAHGSEIAELDSSDQYQYYLRGNTGLWIFAYTLPLALIDSTDADIVLDANGDPEARAYVESVDANVVITADGDVLAAALMDPAQADLVLDASGDVSARAYVSGLAEVVLLASGQPFTAALVSGLAELVLTASGELVPRSYMEAAQADVIIDASGEVLSSVQMAAAQADLVLTASGQPFTAALVSGLAEIVLDALGDVSARAYVSGLAELVLTADGDVLAAALMDPAQAEIVLDASGDVSARAYVSGLAELVLLAFGDWSVWEYGAIEASVRLRATVCTDVEARALVEASVRATTPVQASTRALAPVEAGAGSQVPVRARKMVLTPVEAGAQALAPIMARAGYQVLVEASALPRAPVCARRKARTTVEASCVVLSTVDAKARVRPLEK